MLPLLNFLIHLLYRITQIHRLIELLVASGDVVVRVIWRVNNGMIILLVSRAEQVQDLADVVAHLFDFLAHVVFHLSLLLREFGDHSLEMCHLSSFLAFLNGISHARTLPLVDDLFVYILDVLLQVLDLVRDDPDSPCEIVVAMLLFVAEVFELAVRVLGDVQVLSLRFFSVP